MDNERHRLRRLFEPYSDRSLRLTFVDSEIFVLSNFSPIAPSIYGKQGQWTAVIVEAVSSRAPDFKRLYRPGSGLDFEESDVARVAVEIGGEVLFAAS